MSTTTTTTESTPKKVNYLNNRDILKEIHLSKNTFCSYRSANIDHQYNVILDSVDDINDANIELGQKNAADRIKRETGTIIDPVSIPYTDLVFRINSWEHIPKILKKGPKSITAPTSTPKDVPVSIFNENPDEETGIDSSIDSSIDELSLDGLTFDDLVPDDAGLNIAPALPPAMKFPRLNFAPFVHYRLDADKKLILVGKSHWKGSLDTGEFCATHGQITNKLALMFLKLTERYATRSNWRGYTYNEDMQGHALYHLNVVGLQFNEFKSQNPFAYYTTVITNSFTRVLNIEKREQSTRDDVLELNGLSPSWSRQITDSHQRATNEFNRANNDSDITDDE